MLLILPRPYVNTDWHTLTNSIVVTYRGGEEMGPATANLLFGDDTPHGHLPWQLPPQFWTRSSAPAPPAPNAPTSAPQSTPTNPSPPPPATPSTPGQSHDHFG
ncbi:glycoside hydrolase family 3 C-terminal domain-containing protein [Actinophytocola sp.]|uniref:glycoside hydrolase family 3 C-terminal domain-containing protein n=1 Tax=Actinophytocola sp. TaxID=1872138 RepID=UPI0039C86D3D